VKPSAPNKTFDDIPWRNRGEPKGAQTDTRTLPKDKI